MRPTRLALLILVALGGAIPTVAAAQTPAPLPPPPAGAVVAVHRADGTRFAAISEAQFRRFQDAARSQAQQVPVGEAVPLRAPDFTACVAWLRREGSRAPVAARRRECLRRYDLGRNTAAQQLLNLTWLRAELERRGLTVTEAQLTRERRTLIREQFETERGYRRFLRESGFTDEDVRLDLTGTLAQRLIVRQLSAAVTEGRPGSLERQEAEQAAIDAFRTEFLTRAAASTTCAAALVRLAACGGPIGAASS